MTPDVLIKIIFILKPLLIIWSIIWIYQTYSVFVFFYILYYIKKDNINIINNIINL